MAIDYYSKYLKYKSKYLELKAQLGSGYGNCEVEDCKCKKYYGPKQTRENFTPKCITCTHHYSLHEETLSNKIKNGINAIIKKKV